MVIEADSTRHVFARNLRATRAAMGLDQPSFGERLKVSVQMISAYENAKSLPSPETLSLLVKATNKPLASFFLEDGQTVEAPATEPADPVVTMVKDALDSLRNQARAAQAARDQLEVDAAELKAERDQLAAEVEQLRKERNSTLTHAVTPPLHDKPSPPAKVVPIGSKQKPKDSKPFVFHAALDDGPVDDVEGPAEDLLADQNEEGEEDGKD